MNLNIATRADLNPSAYVLYMIKALPGHNYHIIIMCALIMEVRTVCSALMIKPIFLQLTHLITV